MKIANNKNHIGLLIIAAITCAASIGAYIYMSHAISSITAKVVLAKNVLSIEDVGKNQSQNLTLQYQATAADRRKIRSFFVPSSNVVAFIEAVESTGSLSGASVSLTSVSSDAIKSTKPDSLGTVSAKVEASGSWASVMRALMLAETLSYDIAIDNVSLNLSGTSAGDGKSGAIWNMSYDIDATLIASTTKSS